MEEDWEMNEMVNSSICPKQGVLEVDQVINQLQEQVRPSQIPSALMLLKLSNSLNSIDQESILDLKSLRQSHASLVKMKNSHLRSDLNRLNSTSQKLTPLRGVLRERE